jgi:hypothetical protein
MVAVTVLVFFLAGHLWPRDKTPTGCAGFYPFPDGGSYRCVTVNTTPPLGHKERYGSGETALFRRYSFFCVPPPPEKKKDPHYNHGSVRVR